MLDSSRSWQLHHSQALEPEFLAFCCLLVNDYRALVGTDDAIYRLGLALFDLHTPEHCLKRVDEWFMGPEAPYELQGEVGNVVFPFGYTVAPDGEHHAFVLRRGR